MKNCEKCGIPVRAGRLCQTCRKYEKQGGIWHPLPPYGEVHYDEAGKPICHVCGMAMDKLIEHTKRRHGLDTAEYREAFGLMRKKARLTSPKYSDKMRGYAEKDPTWKTNFNDVHNGRIPRGRRNPHWSPQELASRRGQQIEKGKLSRSTETPEQRAKNSAIWTKNLPNHRKEAEP